MFLGIFYQSILNINITFTFLIPTFKLKKQYSLNYQQGRHMELPLVLSLPGAVVLIKAAASVTCGWLPLALTHCFMLKSNLYSSLSSVGSQCLNDVIERE